LIYEKDNIIIAIYQWRGNEETLFGYICAKEWGLLQSTRTAYNAIPLIF
jgi:hypothetical protein